MHLNVVEKRMSAGEAPGFAICLIVLEFCFREKGGRERVTLLHEAAGRRSLELTKRIKGLCIQIVSMFSASDVGICFAFLGSICHGIMASNNQYSIFFCCINTELNNKIRKICLTKIEVYGMPIR